MTAFDETAGAAGTSYLQPAMAGVLAAVVGFTSTFALGLAGLATVGASPAQAGSGLFAICIVLFLLNISMSWRQRIPISIAWSTPGAAFLMTAGMPEGGFAAATGAFLVAAALIVIAGLWRPLSRAVEAIPAAIANAMLAGILLSLCIVPIKAAASLPAQTLPIILTWVVALRFARRYAVPLAVLATVIVLALTTRLPDDFLAGAWPVLTPIMPTLSLDAILRLALPLFVVTMASQNLPGLAVMQANGYRVAPAPVFRITGLGSAATAIFGGLPVNLAAITAAICAGPEAHPDPARRWVAPIAAGCTYLLLGLGASLAAAFVAATPPILIEAVAGLALFSSFAGALSAAFADEDMRLPAIVTFATTASGITVGGIGGAFWGLVAGLALQFALAGRLKP
jgi:benzoate membrane transport protein